MDPHSSFLFLQLPIELRQMVYDYYIIDLVRSVMDSQATSTLDQPPKLHMVAIKTGTLEATSPPLLRVCKDIRAEMLIRVREHLLIAVSTPLNFRVAMRPEVVTGGISVRGGNWATGIRHAHLQWIATTANQYRQLDLDKAHSAALTRMQRYLDRASATLTTIEIKILLPDIDWPWPIRPSSFARNYAKKELDVLFAKLDCWPKLRRVIVSAPFPDSWFDRVQNTLPNIEVVEGSGNMRRISLHRRIHSQLR